MERGSAPPECYLVSEMGIRNGGTGETNVSGLHIQASPTSEEPEIRVSQIVT